MWHCCAKTQLTTISTSHVIAIYVPETNLYKLYIYAIYLRGIYGRYIKLLALNIWPEGCTHTMPTTTAIGDCVDCNLPTANSYKTNNTCYAGSLSKPFVAHSVTDGTISRCTDNISHLFTLSLLYSHSVTEKDLNSFQEYSGKTSNLWPRKVLRSSWCLRQ